MKKHINCIAVCVTAIIYLTPASLYSQNTAYGIGALASNTTSSPNSAFGFNALFNNTGGSVNSAFGSNSMYNNTSGTYNSAFGESALYSNTSGNQNAAFGDNTLGNNTTGGFNAAFGKSCLRLNNTGSFNAAYGVSSMQVNTTGANNAAFGFQSLPENTTGSYNVAIGDNSLYTNATGSYNTVIGQGADASADNFDNSTALGYTALITASDQVRIGNSTVTSIGGYVNWSNISDGRFKKNIKENIKGLEFILKLKPVSYTLDLTKLDSYLHKNMPSKDGRNNLTAEAIKNKAIKEKIVYNGFVAQDVEKTAQGIGYNFSGIDAPKNVDDIYALRYADFVVPLVKAVQELSLKNEALQTQLDQLKITLESLIGKKDVITGNNVAPHNLLEQNIPNPFSSATSIHYTLASKIISAQLIISDISGKVVKQITLPPTSGAGTVIIEAASLSPGSYQYALVADGRLAGTKKMILTK